MVISYSYGWSQIGSDKQMCLHCRPFDGHADGLKWCTWLCPMQQIQGHTRYLQATTHSILPWRPPGWQSTKQQSNNTPTLLAVLMAIAMQQCDTVCIARWKRSRSSLEATWRCHLVSTRSNYINRHTYSCFVFLFFPFSMHWKWAQSKRMAPNNNRGMTYQIEGKHQSQTVGYLVGRLI